MPPRFLYFDLGNVLCMYDYEVACRQMAEVARVAPADVRRIVFDGDLQRRYETGELTGRQLHKLVCAEVRRLRGDSAPDPDYHALRRAGSAFFELNVPIVPIVTQLSVACYRLGILSNTCESHWEYCHDRFTILRELFHVYTLSYEVGALKPAAEIFRAAADAAGVAPREIFFVDDRPEHVAGARDVGFDAVQFTTPARLAADLRRRGVNFNY